jgi:hypothetical protein
MNQQNNPEPNNQQSVIEDLTVNEDRAEEVKGGYEIKLPDVLVSSYQSGGSSH